MTTAECLTLALQHHQAGRYPQAEQLYRQVLQAEPSNPDALHLLGVLAHQFGKNDLAVSYIQQAITLRPGEASFHANLGLVYQALGRLDDAEACYRQVVRLRPELADGPADLGNVLRQQGKRDEAIAAYRQALRLQPHNGKALNNLGIVLSEQGQLEEAISCWQQAVQFQPNFPEAHNNLGNAFKQLGHLTEAASCYRQALHHWPQSAEIQNNLGTVLMEQGWLDQSIACYRQALRLRPDFPEAHNNLGNALAEQGQGAEALHQFREAIRLRPENAQGHSNLLFHLNHDPTVTPAELFAEHCRWGERFGTVAGPLPRHANDPDPGRRLRIGYVSPDFRSHALARFLEPLLANYDPTQLTIFCYAEVTTPDAITCRLRSSVHTWRWTFGLPDEQVAQQVRDDRIDILVDLAGHTRGHRLGVFAHKPAPVQATYLGYPNTTGLKCIDYRITDAVMDPLDEPSYNTEELVRLPHGVCCFNPPTSVPDVGPLPALQNGCLTLGSLHRLAKLNTSVLDLWGRLLQALPTARLLIFRNTLVAETRDRLARQFAERGIGGQRLELRSQTDTGSHWDVFGEIDLGLDPFPYTGGTISCESLWMGVPFVTLRGDRPAGRGGATLLTSLGLPECIARTPEEVITKTVALASDRARLAELRAGLRERMRETLCNGPAFARDLERAYRLMWQHWCERQNRR